MLATVIICILLLAVAVVGVLQIRKRMKSGCCGGGDTEQIKAAKVSDRDKSHYPYCIQLVVDGMVCGNCAKRVENALNGLEGVWAQVDLGNRTATVRMKTPYPEQQLRTCVSAAGYTVLRTEQRS